MNQNEIEQEIADLRAEKENLVSLMQHPGWPLFVSLIKQGSVVQRNAAFGGLVTTLDGMIEAMNHKIFADGMLSVFSTLDTRIEDLQADLMSLYENQGE